MASLSQCKKAKTKAEKAFKKHPDDEGKVLLEQAGEAMKAKELDKALALLLKAEAVCAASTAAPLAKVKTDKQKAESKAAKGQAPAEGDGGAEPVPVPTVKLLSPGQTYPKHGQGETPNYAINSDELLAQFKGAQGGIWRTRFPPEPNGHLHLGHAKAMNFNFGEARNHGGECILRFDDTNPTAEKQEYIDSIRTSVAWLGNVPTKTTYSSDYFLQLYQFALDLINKGQAYCCAQSKEQVNAGRQAIQDYKALKDDTAPFPAAAISPYRDASIAHNMQRFERMRIGYYDEGAMCLRLKGDLTSDIPSQWDTTAYRVKFHKHPHSIDKWCIYPTYDYTHCIVDSLEFVSHSLCTTEFKTRQAHNGSYYWLLHALDLYRPITWEYSRCNMEYNVMSKRLLAQLVAEKHVRGWDDPRLLTLNGMKRRGYSPVAINQFCMDIGVTERGDTTLPMEKLESCVKKELDANSTRAFGITHALKVTISNYSTPHGEVVEVANHPKDTSMGTRPLRFGSTLYIDQSDFREEDVKGFFGLAPGKEVRLLQAYNITYEKCIKDASGKVVEVVCTYDTNKSAKVPKGKVQWVDAASAVPVEFRIYDHLFTAKNPKQEAKDKGVSWLSYLNPNSLVVCQGFVEASVGAAVPGTTFQLQRVGYFCVDEETTTGRLVLNRTLPLKLSSDLKAFNKQ